VDIDTRGSTKQTIQFLNHLNSNPQMSVHRMVGSNQNVTIWRALRRLLRLKGIFSGRQDVTEVRERRAHASQGIEPALEVQIVLASLLEHAHSI